MLRKKFAVLALLVAATAAAPAAPAFADGPKNDKEAAVCSHLLGSVFPGLVPTQTVCKVNSDHHGSGSGSGQGQAQDPGDVVDLDD